MGRKIVAMSSIYWYDSGRCERDSEDLYEDLQQSKIQEIDR
jgi:hypothetical protein